MKALILVDIQNDFCPGGALAVAGGDEVVAVANGLASKFELVVATQDWHPANHESFAANNGGTVGEVIDLHGLRQVVWPTHCVQGSVGADFHPDLEASAIDRVFRKGTDARVDSYSGFYDNRGKQDDSGTSADRGTGLGAFLRERGVDAVYVMGLATDYCVRFTALDAVAEGFATFLIEDGCRGVELAAGDSAAALEEMRDAGVVVAERLGAVTFSD